MTIAQPAQPEPIEVDDLVVLLLGAPGPPGQERGRIDGITRLEKLVFLVEKEREPQWLSESAGFTSDKFGPFSAKIYDAVETLSAAGLLEDSAELSSTSDDAWESEHVIGEVGTDPYATRNFELTALGQRYYTALLDDLPAGVEDDLAKFKQQFAALPLRRLIRYVYERYPGYTDKSIIRDDILRY